MSGIAQLFQFLVFQKMNTDRPAVKKSQVKKLSLKRPGVAPEGLLRNKTDVAPAVVIQAF